jgi:hypothetical protein
MNASDGRWRFVKASDLANDTVGFDRLEVRSATSDENLGKLKGFIVDSDSRQLHFVVVDSGGWLSSDSYLIPPAFTRVDAEQRVLWAETTRNAIRRFPEFRSSDYPTLTNEDLWRIEQEIIAAYGDDPGVVAPEPTWNRQSWSHYRQPDWWRPDYAARSPQTATIVTTAAAATAAGQASPGRTTSRTEWPDPGRERAQPGDVLGIERGGETTGLGDTAADEDKRREAAEREFRDELERDVRDQAAKQRTNR